MANSENTRLLAEEKQAAQAETGLIAQEQGLWQRLEAAQDDAVLAQRASSLLSRLTALEAAGIKTPDFAKARNVLQAAATPEPVIAQQERASALAVRRASVQAREIAARQLAQALVNLEAARGSQRRDLETIDTFLQSAERANAQRLSREKAAADQRSSAATEMMAAPSIPTPPPRQAPSSAPTPAPMPAAPPAAAPAPAPAARAVSAPPPAAAPAPAPAPRPAPVTQSGEMQMTTNTRIRKLSKRRRVRLAPPPKKLDVEVAVYGDNTFYTGFDNRIATGGLFVSTLETLPAGWELDLAIDLEGKKISTRGKVEFVRIDNTANPECTPGAGIKLLNLPADAASSIESFFQKRQPLFVQTRA